MRYVDGLAEQRTLVIGPNMSLSRAGRGWFFASMMVVSLGIATVWALNGAWYVVPFAGIEMAVLYAALTAVERRVGDGESITVDGDRVIVERTRIGKTARYEFHRCWARVVMTESVGRHRGVLVMRSHGREVEIGDFLTDPERIAVADELRRRLGNI